MFITSCICPNKDFSTTYITIHSARALFYSFDENGVFPHLEEFNRNELGISIFPDSTSEILEIAYLPSLGSSAYACQNPHEIFYTNSIESINIYTIYNFDDEHPANSKINDILLHLNTMGETTKVDNISDFKFIDIHFKFSEIPKFDTMQFLVTGHLTDKEDLQITTELTILE